MGNIKVGDEVETVKTISVIGRGEIVTVGAGKIGKVTFIDDTDTDIAIEIYGLGKAVVRRSSIKLAAAPDETAQAGQPSATGAAVDWRCSKCNRIYGHCICDSPEGFEKEPDDFQIVRDSIDTAKSIAPAVQALNRIQAELAALRKRVADVEGERDAARLALRDVSELAGTAQGQWVAVQPEYAPNWANDLKEIEKRVEDVYDELKWQRGIGS